MRQSLITLNFVAAKLDRILKRGSGSLLVPHKAGHWRTGVVVMIGRGGDITKQRHESLNSVLSTRLSGTRRLKRAPDLTWPSLEGLQGTRRPSDGVGTGQNGKSEPARLR